MIFFSFNFNILKFHKIFLITRGCKLFLFYYTKLALGEVQAIGKFLEKGELTKERGRGGGSQAHERRRRPAPRVKEEEVGDAGLGEWRTQ